MPRDPNSLLDNDPLWYKDAVIYEVHVRAFYDSEEDGAGDFPGLTQKLDYLQDLGVTAIWLLPFFPSPWRDDGYDISDYTDVHPAYGTLRDFQVFLREAHRRGLRVITEVVVNHTSDQHPWFQRSRRAAPGTPWRDFYVWRDTDQHYQQARIIFKDFETSNWTWDPVAKAWYWHRFYSHQPDLNFDSPHVRKAILEVVDFWLDMGVDGFRLDAIPYLFEREDTNCENLPETHAFLREMRAHVDAKYPGRLLLAEANQWPEDAIAYFGAGDECHMAFHFPLMPRLFMSIRMEDRYPINEILDQTPAIPASCQWASFLRNHDELTLEMVTDEERDYMYRVYAQDRQTRINLGIRRRLAPLLGNDRRKIELMNALLFSLLGTPVIYYGDEIGMGDNVYLGDRNGVRTPMQWSADRNGGFSRANPQKLYLPITIDPEYHYESINVESQQKNSSSLLWWMKHLIEQRKRSQAFGRGTVEFLYPDNRRVLAFYRRYEGENILVVANLSRFPQFAALDLSEFKGYHLMEMFGRAEFPPVGDQPYVITLGAHDFYWFSLETKPAQPEPAPVSGPEYAAVVDIESWDKIFEGRTMTALTRLMPSFLNTRRWFLGKDRPLRDVSVLDVVPIPETDSFILLVQIDYGGGDPEIYVLTAAVATGAAIQQVREKLSDSLMVRLRKPDGEEGVLYGALWDKAFCDALLNAMAKRRRFRSPGGELAAAHTRAFRDIWGPDRPKLDPSVLRADQSHSSIMFGERFVLKLLRRVEPGINPEVEMLDFLTRAKFPHAPRLAGTLEYRPAASEALSIGVMQGFVRNQGTAWQYTLDSLGRYFETALAGGDPLKALAGPVRHPLDLRREAIPSAMQELIGEYSESARLLGQRTAELHLALESGAGLPEFVPEPFTDHYRLGLFHRITGLATRMLELLRQRLPSLPRDVQVEASRVLGLKDELRDHLRPLRDRRLSALRIRCHGDLHLNRILHTGKDFVFIDFEGELSRPLSERRIKRSPLQDVASMLSSFRYAAYAVLFGRVAGVMPRPEATGSIEAWAGHWHAWISARFLKGYLDVADQGLFLPAPEDDLRLLLDTFLLEETIDEVTHDIVDRPEWARIPLHGIVKLLL
ncbi:MAG: maltose alpha-D-glucosyltransferase [Acidobacteriota bacterium]|nr:maltose alpha-D-glucosyltransferase [Acidobacteriota bacterium]